MDDNVLNGQRILVVEDNALLAMCFSDILRRAGAEIAGPTGKLAEAERIARTETLTAAMLDIRLNSHQVWSVARILEERGVPFVFCSGHFDHISLPAEWSKHAILVKPARPHQIVATLAQAVAHKT